MSVSRPFSILGILIFLWLFNPRVVGAVTTHDMADSSKWNIRIDGASATATLNEIKFISEDLNRNGKKELLIASSFADNNSRTNSGSLYVIYDDLLESISGKGNTIDLANPSNYSIRFDGAYSNGWLAYNSAVGLFDVDNDGYTDLLIGEPRANNNSISASGSLYVIFNSLLQAYTGTGNNVDLSSSSNYNLRYDGAGGTDWLSQYSSITTGDFDNNGKNDLVIGSVWANNGGADTGSVYVIFDSLIDDYSGTGNNIPLGTSSNYQLRLDGATAEGGGFGMYLLTKDINSDSKVDLILGYYCNSYHGGCTGAVYVLYNSLFEGISGTGNIRSISSSTNYSFRVTGQGTLYYASLNRFMVLDIDGDGGSDLLIPDARADNNSRTDSGSIYLVKQERFQSFTGTGNTLDLASSSSYNLRIDGASASDGISSSLNASELNNDGSVDLVFSASADYNGRNNSGSVYVVPGSILNSYPETGTNLDLASESIYSVRYDGASESDSFGGTNGILMQDINNDGSLDLLVNSSGSDNNSRADSGSLYIIYNFPHSFSLSSLPSTISLGSPITVTGTISASDSVTNISGVQFSSDNTSFSGTWTDCTASDGAFDSTTESFSCNVGSSLSNDPHTIYVRAYDTNGSYTASSNYGSVGFWVGSPHTYSQPSTTAGHFVCSGEKPYKAPEIFQIKTNDTQATLYFTPLTSKVTSYQISYGFTETEERFGTEYPQGPYLFGPLSVTINLLSPQTTYYFKIRAANGCMPGDWSNILGAKSTSSKSRNSVFHLYGAKKSP